MKAAPYKDLVVNRTRLIVLSVLTVTLGGLGIYMREPIILPSIPGIVEVIYFTTAFTRDSESKVNRIILTGPITRTQLINLNYLTIIMLGE